MIEFHSLTKQSIKPKKNIKMLATMNKRTEMVDFLPSLSLFMVYCDMRVKRLG